VSRVRRRTPLPLPVGRHRLFRRGRSGLEGRVRGDRVRRDRGVPGHAGGRLPLRLGEGGVPVAVNQYLPDFLVTKLDYVANLGRKPSLWPMPFATACCGIELMATASSRYDIARFGSEAMRFSPRRCDVMIVAGRVVMKMVPVMQRIWLQM